MQCVQCHGYIPGICPHCYSKITVQTIVRMKENEKRLEDCQKLARQLLQWIFELQRGKVGYVG